jgi:hypothetical protein
MNSRTLPVNRLTQIEQARLNVMNEGAFASPWLSDWISQSWQRCLQPAKPCKAHTRTLSHNNLSHTHLI